MAHAGATGRSGADGPDGRRPNARSLLRHWFAWSLVALGGVLAFVMSFSYLHAFLEPTTQLEHLPVGIINLDRGATALDQHLDAGKQVFDEATKPPADGKEPVRWVQYRTRAALTRDIRDFKLYGGFVIPADFSSRIVALGLAGGLAPAARIEVLQSSGAGQFGAAVFERIADTLVPQASDNVRAQLVEQLNTAGARISPDGAKSLGTPVIARNLDLVPITDTSGRGLAAFYFALMMTLAGFATTTAVSIGIDVLGGHEEFDVLGRIIRFPDRGVSESARWRAKLVIAMAMAPLAALAETLMAVNILGMQTSSTTKLFFFAWLGIAAIAALTLVFLVAFGIIGELVAVIFITIFGVPSALGVYPQYALPPLFQFISDWHPMRFVTDGVRSIVFFDGRSASGIGTAIPVLIVYLVGSILAGWGLAKVVDVWTAHHRDRHATVVEPLAS